MSGRKRYVTPQERRNARSAQILAMVAVVASMVGGLAVSLSFNVGGRAVVIADVIATAGIVALFFFIFSLIMYQVLNILGGTF